LFTVSEDNFVKLKEVNIRSNHINLFGNRFPEVFIVYRSCW
jgi:hypothetical protein